MGQRGGVVLVVVLSWWCLNIHVLVYLLLSVTLPLIVLLDLGDAECVCLLLLLALKTTKLIWNGG